MWVLHLLLKLELQPFRGRMVPIFLMKIISDLIVAQIVELIEMMQGKMKSACILHHDKFNLSLRKKYLQ